MKVINIYLKYWAYEEQDIIHVSQETIYWGALKDI